MIFDDSQFTDEIKPLATDSSQFAPLARHRCRHHDIECTDAVTGNDEDGSRFAVLRWDLIDIPHFSLSTTFKR